MKRAGKKLTTSLNEDVCGTWKGIALLALLVIETCILVWVVVA